MSGMTHLDANTQDQRIRVEFNNQQNCLAINLIWAEGVVTQTLHSEAICHADISVAFLTDASIRVINQRFLSHDWATDVISFPFSATGQTELTGELIISAEMAKNVAAAACYPVQDELALYLVHGLLHLCGYDDRTASDLKIMRDREAAVFAVLGIPNPFGRVRPLSVSSEESGRESVRWPR